MPMCKEFSFSHRKEDDYPTENNEKKCENFKIEVKLQESLSEYYGSTKSLPWGSQTWHLPHRQAKNQSRQPRTADLQPPVLTDPAPTTQVGQGLGPGDPYQAGMPTQWVLVL